ncbi:hypothetical protein CFR75_16390 [Komagataeibacter xylinus]|uniref:DUF1488 domain-containing protein n=1 Tax=Komagataeibacter xylinus TaxID=28448 RepID=A0A318PH81_KOMXY|nr:DUF1488 family protein [Komagataeibacter xylinus]PYD55465.1 hypothetical protein CFR75_16390 [Komagataeibacter xylinus]GBQ74861.1 hypothetical protein AA15237_1994 [Komagataeibacter xylinus NBRC 15237]
MPTPLPVGAQAKTEAASFQIASGTGRVEFIVSDEALEAAACLARPSTAAARQHAFQRFRVLIDAAAKLKLARSGKTAGATLFLSSEDLRHVPHEKGMPVFGHVPRPVLVPPSVPSDAVHAS